MYHRVDRLGLVLVVVVLSLLRSLRIQQQRQLFWYVNASEPIIQPQPPLKIFLLAGQSNMVGMGNINHLDLLIQSDTSNSNKFRSTLWNNTSNNYNLYNDVYIKFGPNFGPLTISRTSGYANRNCFGPEALFGTTMATYIRNNNTNNTNNNSNNITQPTILLIKTAYGGLDLAIDFRPPSAGIGNYSHIMNTTYYGWGYRMMIYDILRALRTIRAYVPNYDPSSRGYEILGFVWFQGWHDVLNWDKANEYESNLAHLIRDIRTDLNQSNLPFVIGELGMHGVDPVEYGAERALVIRSAQRNVCNRFEFRSNTKFVPTSPYVVSNGTKYDGIHHYYGRADTYYDIGESFGHAMYDLLNNETTVPTISPLSNTPSRIPINSPLNPAAGSSPTIFSVIFSFLKRLFAIFSFN